MRYRLQTIHTAINFSLWVPHLQWCTVQLVIVLGLFVTMFCQAGCLHTAVRPSFATCVQGYGDDDYLIFDCPGQIELYSHATVFRTFVDWMKGQGWSLCAVYCLDSQFVMETPKFIAGSLQAMAAMVQLELPHVNVLTKADLIQDKVGFSTLCVVHIDAM